MSALVGRPAPAFTAPAVMSNGAIKEDFSLSGFKGRYIALFFWPLDFTFVCPSEIIAHDHRLGAFEQRGVQLIGVSVDSVYTHHAWRSIPSGKGGIGSVGFPLVSDIKHDIAKAYGIEHPDAGVAMRASFLIDRGGIVQHQVVNNLPLGRNADELLRMVDALQYYEQHGEVCPAGWKKGQVGIKPTAEGVAEYLEKHGQAL